jgi:hypothetical protein
MELSSRLISSASCSCLRLRNVGNWLTLFWLCKDINGVEVDVCGVAVGYDATC